MRFSIQRQCCSLFAPHDVNPCYASSKESQIIQLCRSGALLDAVQVLNSVSSTDEITVKPIVYASLLQTCTKVVLFGHGLQIHAHVVKSGLETDRFVGNSLLALYFKLGRDFAQTQRVFSGLFVKDVVSWTSMLTGFVKVGKPRNALELFFDMLKSEIEPNGFTLSAVVKACSELGYLVLGQCFHGVVFRRGFDSNQVIVSSLIDMYGRNFKSNYAARVFEEMPEPDSICWTSVISSFTRNDMFDEGLGFFFQMQKNYALTADGFTFGTVLTACANLGRLRQGKEVHSKVISRGLSGNIIVESSLVDMYGKCGSVGESQRVFDRMIKKNSVSRSALLGVYCQNGDFEQVIELFRKMEDTDLYSFGTVLRACAGLAAVRQGKEVHCQYVRRGGWRDVIVESALVDLYAKCGCIDFADRIFTQMQVKNLISWNSMINGLAQNGRGKEAIQVFSEMIKAGVEPDYITFIGVLFACSHTGLVDQGRHYFCLMREKYGIKAGLEHYNCMVDLLGRAALIEEAENLIEKADYRRCSSLWQVLLGACTTCRDSATAERVAKKMMKLEPDHHLSYVQLANIYRAEGRWEDASKIRRLMRNRRVNKIPGQSWIESSKLSSPYLHCQLISSKLGALS